MRRYIVLVEVGMSICFFIGHRDTPADVYSQIVAEVERPILCGVTEFVVGHYGAFDRMAARAVREAKGSTQK